MAKVDVEQVRLRDTLHDKGLRMTEQRRLVLNAVRALEHATPEQICREVASVNITTVYRTLELLERLGLVRHTHLGHGAPTYSAQEHRHVHLVCHRCGHVDEVPVRQLAELAGTLRATAGFELDASHLALSGRCAGCADSVSAHSTYSVVDDQEPS
jgi:Fur family ferric uptake transcriptional regulator